MATTISKRFFAKLLGLLLAREGSTYLVDIGVSNNNQQSLFRLFGSSWGDQQIVGQRRAFALLKILKTPYSLDMMSGM
jgi:hypothetical protein